MRYMINQHKNIKSTSLMLLMIVMGICYPIFFMDFISSYTMVQAISACVLFLFILLTCKTLYIPQYLFLSIIFCGYLLVNIIVGGQINFICVFIFNIILLIGLVNIKGCSRTLCRVMIFYSTIHLIGTVFVQVMPTVVANSFLKILLKERYFTNLDWRINQHSNVGITAHPGNNALYLSVFLAFCFAKIVGVKQKNRMIYYVGCVVSIVGIALTNKRAPLLLNIITMIIVYVIYNKQRISKLKLLRMLVIGSGIGIFLFLGLYQTDVFQSIIQKNAQLMHTGDISNGRISLWTFALKMFEEKPILGIGLKKIYALKGLDVHNIYIQFLVETGLVGISIFLGMLIAIVKNSVKTINAYKDEEQFIAEKLVGFYLVIYICLYGAVSNVFMDYIPLGIFIISIVLANSYGQLERKER